jgi:prepilin-type N-terminal cleavage/methylation domain-containing protein
MGRRNNQAGLSLTEILVVAAILGILILLAALSIRPSFQIAKANDERRKADLKKISIALEDYAGDHPCYPETIYGTGCNPSAEMDSYLNPLPCDPGTKQPYVYERPACSQYAVYATLQLEESVTYGQDKGNYALSSANLTVEPTILPTPTSGQGGGETPTESPGTTTTPTPTGTYVVRYYGCVNQACTLLSTGSPPGCTPHSIWDSQCDLETECCEAPCGSSANECR